MIWTERPMEFAQNRIDSRQYILLPRIGEIISELRSRSVLDYGCGEGYLGRHITDKSVRFGIFDISDVMLRLATVNLGDAGFTSVTAFEYPEAIGPGTFDCVVLSLVLMTLQSDEEYLSVITNCTEAMRKDGRLIIGVTHPCFRSELFSTHHTEYALGSGFDYFENNKPFRVYLRTSEMDKHLSFDDFHHNLSYMFSMLGRAGLIVEGLEELRDSSLDGDSYNRTASPYLLLMCRKS